MGMLDRELTKAEKQQRLGKQNPSLIREIAKACREAELLVKQRHGGTPKRTPLDTDTAKPTEPASDFFDQLARKPRTSKTAQNDPHSTSDLSNDERLADRLAAQHINERHAREQAEQPSLRERLQAGESAAAVLAAPVVP
jgi:hypothetical protein